MQGQENTEKSELRIAIELTQNAEKYLALASRWAKIISIISFVFIGTYSLLVIGGTLVKLVDGEANALGVSILAMTLLAAGICFIPNLYLYRFAKSSKAALEAKDEVDFENSLFALGNSLRFVGFMLILMAIFYAFGLLIVINDVSMILA